MITQARDSFYECANEVGAGFQQGQPIPEACKAVRKEYELCCSAAWVRGHELVCKLP